MKGKTKKLYLLVLAVISIALLAGSLLTPGMAKHESIQEAMKDAVLHESNRIALFGMEVNPALLSDLILVGTLLLAAVMIRLFVIPKFRDKPGRFQLLLEAWVGLFTGMAKENSPHRNQALGGYIFFAGSWISMFTAPTISEAKGTAHGIWIDAHQTFMLRDTSTYPYRSIMTRKTAIRT